MAAPSPHERNTTISLEQKLASYSQAYVVLMVTLTHIFFLEAEEGVVAGAKASVVATIATAIPTHGSLVPIFLMASARMLPWARANLNHTAQALIIISTVTGAAYFIVADKIILGETPSSKLHCLTYNCETEKLYWCYLSPKPMMLATNL